MEDRIISPYKDIGSLKKFRGPWHTHMAGEFPDPSTVRELCRDSGFQFVGVTEHDNRYAALGWSEGDWYTASDEEFIFIRGFEATHPIGHITCLGFSPQQTGVDAKKAQRNRFERMDLDAGYGGFLKRASGLGAFLALNHPHIWRGNLSELLQSPDFDLIDAMEIYNGNQLGKSRARGYTVDIYDSCLGRGASLWLAANPDCHSWDMSEPDGPFNGYSAVYAEELSWEGILSSLKAGRFYSSNGLEIREINIGDNSMEVIADVCCSISFIGPGGRVLKQVTDSGAEYDFSGGERWVRAELELRNASRLGSSDFPLKAWLQPARLR